jgi:SAM-dependent methyltransferase
VDSSIWDERYSGSDLVWSSTPNVWVEQVTAELAPGRVLDLAGGEGRNALWLAERGWQATVVDFSQVALDRVRTLAAERLGAAGRPLTVHADLLTYQPELKAFDLVLVVYLQIVAEDRRNVLRRAANAVATGGRLLVVAHDSTNVTAGVGGPQDPGVLYTAEDVSADIAGTGLTVERCETVLRPVPTDDGPRNAIDALLLARRSADA